MLIAKRIARELRDGMLVNLGIGIPTLVSNYVPPVIHIFFQSENGLIGRRLAGRQQQAQYSCNQSQRQQATEQEAPQSYWCGQISNEKLIPRITLRHDWPP